MGDPAPPVIGIREPGALELVQSLLRQDVAVRIRVSGDSMRPLLQGGELMEVVPLDGKVPRIGDIFFIRSRRNAPVIHRLIWWRCHNGELYLLTKGDACAGFDGFIPVKQVIGRVDRIFLADQYTVLLQTPLMRFRACLIVLRTLFAHAWRKWNV
jgi:signal peptidase I